MQRSFLFLFLREFLPWLHQWAMEHYQLPSEDKNRLPVEQEVTEIIIDLYHGVVYLPNFSEPKA